MDAHVLDVVWPDGTHPLALPNFETRARRRRYQVLGTACRSFGIRSLLLAHHEDDQAETVFMRLSQGHRGPGLQAINTSGGIPECNGMYGVHQSGELELMHRRLGAKRVRKALPDHEKEDGGVTIHRPILGFDKSILEATCQHYGTEWTEDLTNRIPTMTSRNTIRYLLEGDKVPLGLRKPRLLALAENMRRKESVWEQYVSNILMTCLNVSNLHRSFDPRSGRLIVRLPNNLIESYESWAGKKDSDPDVAISNARHAASKLIQRLILAVSPIEKVPESTLQSSIESIFPELMDLASIPRCLDKFTVGGVQFTRTNPSETQRYRDLTRGTPLPQTRAPKAVAYSHRGTVDPNAVIPTTSKSSDISYANEWELVRQPYSKATDPAPSFTISPQDIDPDAIPFPTSPFAKPSTDQQGHGTWSKFHLWDNRFWIRIRLDYPISRHSHDHTNSSHTPAPITSAPPPKLSTFTIRAFHPSDLKPFLASLNAPPTIFSRPRKEAAPGKIMETLPVIVHGANHEEHGNGDEDQEGQVLAVPTLGVMASAARREGLTWEVRYRRVDLGIGGMARERDRGSGKARGSVDYIRRLLV